MNLSPRLQRPTPAGQGLLYLLVALLSVEALRCAYDLYQAAPSTLLTFLFCNLIAAIAISYLRRK